MLKFVLFPLITLCATSVLAEPGVQQLPSMDPALMQRIAVDQKLKWEGSFGEKLKFNVDGVEHSVSFSEFIKAMEFKNSLTNIGDFEFVKPKERKGDESDLDIYQVKVGKKVYTFREWLTRFEQHAEPKKATQKKVKPVQQERGPMQQAPIKPAPGQAGIGR